MTYSSVTGLTSQVAIAKGQVSPEQIGMYSNFLGLEIKNVEPDHKYDGVVFDGKKVFEMIEEGDHIAVCTTGAYNYSMASNYNRLPRPPIVMLRDGESYLAVRRETLEDLVRLDV